MEELLIEDKKYVSSKRAAQMTGYAKDYIGQLCREGRVPARLVGRSWYVLESAIEDHRFGDKETAKEPVKKTQESSSHTPAWSQPRYKALSGEELPVIKRIEHVESEREIEKEAPEVPKHMHEAWQAWFEHVASTKEVATDIPEEGVEVEEQEKEDIPAKEIPENDSGDVKIPIKAIFQPELTPPKHREVSPVQMDTQDQEEVVEEVESVSVVHPVPRKHRSFVAIQVSGAVLAVVAAVLSVAGTGYFDIYLTSLSQARLIAGVSVYNK